jgi:hypothetical protein
VTLSPALAVPKPGDEIMWFRFVLAIAVVAMLGLLWMLLAPTRVPPAGEAVRPAAEIR